MKKIYLAASIVGAVIPLYFFIQFFSTEQNVNLQPFVAALFVNGATAGFTADLLISSFVFWALMWNNRCSGPHPWLFIVLNLTIGLSCALPAYLYAAERKKAGSTALH